MDFDFEQIATPFRMQPGLARLSRQAVHLTPLRAGSALHAEKRQVMQAGPSRLAVPGFDLHPALESIAERAALEGVEGALAAGAPLELAFEQDFAVLDGETGTLPWLCVCVPSHWAPEEKLGRGFAEVHAPVADNAALLAASRQLVQLVTGGECWERHVWTVSPSGRYDQHPARHAREPWPGEADPHAFSRGCFLRVERQTFFPVGRGTRQAIFTIRVQIERLAQAVDTPGKAMRLHESLASMSDAAATYKGLAQARPRLLAWLDAAAHA